MVADDEDAEAVRAARGSGEGGGVNMAWREGIGVKEREGKGRTEDRTLTRTRKSRSLRPLSDAPFFGRMGLGGAVSAGTGDRCCKSVRSGPLEGERGGGEIEKEKRTSVAIRAGVSGGHERTVTAEAERAWRAEGVVLALRARRGRWKTERTESGTRQGSSPRDQWPPMAMSFPTAPVESEVLLQAPPPPRSSPRERVMERDSQSPPRAHCRGLGQISISCHARLRLARARHAHH